MIFNASWCRRWRNRRSFSAIYCHRSDDEMRIYLHPAMRNRLRSLRPKWRATRPFHLRRRRRSRRRCRRRCRRRRHPGRKSTSRCLRFRLNGSWCGDEDRSCAGRLSYTKCTRTVSNRCASTGESSSWTAGWNCARKPGICAATLPNGGSDGRPASAIGRNPCRNRRIWTASPSNECIYSKRKIRNR